MFNIFVLKIYIYISISSRKKKIYPSLYVAGKKEKGERWDKRNDLLLKFEREGIRKSRSVTRRCDGNIGARQAKVSRHIFPEEAARISIGPARRRDLNRIHWRRASEWQHKRAANLPNLLHQRGTRGLLLNSGHQRNWWKKKKKKERKRKKERKKEKRRRERRGGYFHRDEKPPAIPLSRFSREETRIVSKSRNVLPLFRVRRTRK